MGFSYSGIFRNTFRYNAKLQCIVQKCSFENSEIRKTHSLWIFSFLLLSLSLALSVFLSLSLVLFLHKMRRFRAKNVQQQRQQQDNFVRFKANTNVWFMLLLLLRYSCFFIPLCACSAEENTLFISNEIIFSCVCISTSSSTMLCCWIGKEFTFQSSLDVYFFLLILNKITKQLFHRFMLHNRN